jgi:hypothetical protein
MRIARLRISGFRGIQEADIRLTKQAVLIVIMHAPRKRASAHRHLHRPTVACGAVIFVSVRSCFHRQEKPMQGEQVWCGCGEAERHAPEGSAWGAEEPPHNAHLW